MVPGEVEEPKTEPEEEVYEESQTVYFIYFIYILII